MACLCYGGLEFGGALARSGRMDFAEPDASPNYGPDRSVRIKHMDVFLRMEPAAQKFSGSAQISFDALPLRWLRVS